MRRIIAPLFCLMLMGIGCRDIANIGRPQHCPDVCAAVCAGLPEPHVPQNCPIPSCACPGRNPLPDQGATFDPTAPVSSVDIFACEVDDDCLYADRSICPFTNRENIVAVNGKYIDVYMASQPSREGVACIEIWAGYGKPPTCVGGRCAVDRD